MTLNQSIQNLLGDLAPKLPPAVFDKLKSTMARLHEARVGSSALKVGSKVPDVSLTDELGRSIALSSLYKKPNHCFYVLSRGMVSLLRPDLACV